MNYEDKLKPWSEEDEKMLNDIIMCGEHHCYLDAGNIAWLVSLKERVQPKQEWSEEDIVAIDCAVEVLNKDLPSLAASIERLKSLRPRNWTKEDRERYISCLQRLSTGNPEQPETINSKWFKEHVYPQSTWKPSDIQLECLSDAVKHYNSLGFPAPKLKELLDDLKKLKG